MTSKKKLGVLGPRDPYAMWMQAKLVGGPADGLIMAAKLDRVLPVYYQKATYIPWQMKGTIVWADDSLSHQEILEAIKDRGDKING